MLTNQNLIIALLVVLFVIALGAGFYFGLMVERDRQRRRQGGKGKTSSKLSSQGGGQKLATKVLSDASYGNSMEVIQSLFSTLIELEAKGNPELFSVLSSFLLNNTSADYAALLLKAKKTYKIEGSAGFSPVHLEKMNGIKYDGYIRWFEDKNLPIILKEKHGDHQGKPFRNIDQQFKDVVIYPLSPQNECIGMVVGVTRKKGGNFQEVDEYLFSVISGIYGFYIHNLKLNMQLQQTMTDTTIAIANFLEKRDEYTQGHSERVKDLSVDLARRLHCDRGTDGKVFVDTLSLSASLHDIGKIGIEDKILNKPGKLTEKEFAKIQEHPEIGAQMIKPLHFLKDALPGVLYHHEKYDGTGYPRGLKGDKIPLAAKIITVADVYDALTTDRPYRKAFSKEVAISMMQEMNRKNFDPEILHEFVTMMLAQKEPAHKKEVVQ